MDMNIFLHFQEYLKRSARASFCFSQSHDIMEVDVNSMRVTNTSLAVAKAMQALAIDLCAETIFGTFVSKPRLVDSISSISLSSRSRVHGGTSATLLRAILIELLGSLVGL